MLTMRPQNASFAIVKGLITIASDLGIRVVAEGVETPLQAAQLRRVRCPLAQGFHFARPADHRAVTRLLRQARVSLPDLAILPRDASPRG
jgi:EAL domain-containing protein (putative c-di-GMP-specific phosphodiesterase class I)